MNNNRSRRFGLDWLREKLHHKHQHDRRMETALLMLERFGAIEWNESDRSIRAPKCTVGDLPKMLANADGLQEKLQRDQLKLYALVKYVHCETDRQEYLRKYFGLDS